MKISLGTVKESEYPQFQRELQDAFEYSVVEKFGEVGKEHIPPDADVQESLYAPNAAIYHIICDGEKVGGVVLQINEVTQHNSVDLFFVSTKKQSLGLGYTAWKAIEEKYPNTKVWELGTPYFETRNINFYVNKCGFHIVEFYNKHHPDPHMSSESEDLPGNDGFFRFEKVMK